MRIVNVEVLGSDREGRSRVPCQAMPQPSHLESQYATIPPGGVLLPLASWDFVSWGAPIMMALAQTKRRRRQYVLLDMVLLFAGVVGSVMGLLKHLYVMKVAQGPIAKLVTALWDVPGVSWLWHHASLNSSYPSGDGWSVYIILCFGLMLVG